MRTHFALALTFALAATALADGKRVTLPPCPVNLPGEVHDAINAARKAYDVDDHTQRQEAVRMFGAIMDQNADLYIEMIGYDDGHPAVRLEAVQVFVKREHPKAAILAARLATSSAPRKYIDAGSEIVRRSGSKEAIALVVEAMKKGISGFEDATRMGCDPGATTWSVIVPKTMCARSLGRIGTRDAVDALLPMLKDPDWEMRVAAARALGDAGDPLSVPALLKAAEDKDLDVECEAMIALGRIGSAEATDFLQKAVKRVVSERETHYEIECYRNDVYVRIAGRALKLSLAQRAAAPPAPVPPAPGPKVGGGGGAPAGGGTTVEEPKRPEEAAGPGVPAERKFPPDLERDEAGEDLMYVCDSTLTMTDAKPCVLKLVEERLMYRDLASDFRFSFIAFRDYGNQYLTDALYFTRDVEKARTWMTNLKFTGGNAGAGSAAEKALQVAVMMDWSDMPRKRLVLITDTYPNDEEDLYFRGHFLHDDMNVVINCLFHTHAQTKRVILQKLAKIGGGHADFLPCDKANGRPRESAEVR